MMELRVVARYPEQMNIYADRGNILFLKRRCSGVGSEFSYAAAGPGQSLDPSWG
jgi:CobQ-like glutamine amidotransferase family enzyme